MRISYSSFVLLVCYILYPLINILSLSIGITFNRLIFDLSLASAFFVSCLAARNFNFYINFYQRVIVAFVFIFLLLGLLKPVPIFINLMEVKPFIYILIFGSLILNKDIPNTRSFILLGKALASIVTIEFLLRSLVNSEFVRPVGSGEINYDAFLICISLICLINSEKFKPLDLFLIAIGLLCSMSRTGILVAALIILTSKKIGWIFKSISIVLSLFFIFKSFTTRGLAFNFEDFDRIQMWESGLDIIINNFLDYLLRIGPANLSPDISSSALMPLWSSQAQQNRIDGIYSYNFHSFILRFILSWGIIPFGLLFIITAKKFLLQNISSMKIDLFILFFIFSLTSGFLYLSNLIFPILFIAYISLGASLKERVN